MKTPVSPLFVSQSAIYEFLGRALEINHQIKIPTKIAKTRMKDNPHFFYLQDV